MSTTLKQQAEAVKCAAKARFYMFNKIGSPLNKEYEEQDQQYKALNDAFSTLTALRLNESLSPPTWQRVIDSLGDPPFAPSQEFVKELEKNYEVPIKKLAR